LENIRIDDFKNYEFLSGIKYSDDGRYGCFVNHKMDYEENKYSSNLWIYNTEDDNVFKLTSFNNESNFIWYDNSTILFQAIRNDRDKARKEAGDEFTVFYKINIHGGEAIEAFRIPKNVNNIMKVNDNTLIFSSTHQKNKIPLDALDKSKKEEEFKRRNEEKDFEVLEEIPFWSNGEGFVDGNREQLYIYDLNSKKYEPITDEDINVEMFRLNKDKNKIVFIGSRYKGKMDIKNAIYICNLNSKHINKITPDETFIYDYADFLGDDIICTGSDMKGYGLNENVKFYLISLDTNNRKSITPDLDVSLWNSVGSDCRYGASSTKKVDGDYMYFTTTEGYNTYLNRIDKDGDIEKVITGDGSIDGFDALDGKIIFIALRGIKLQELYRYDKDREIQVTHFNDWVLNERNVSIPEKIKFETESGIFIDGWVMKPISYKEDKKYPALLNIHGGPKSTYGEVFYHEMQYWAGLGYFVFFCNPRGSDGRGNEFADIRGKYGTIDYDDIMRFTDYVLKMYPSIDKDRVGVLGGSYGGFMTNWIIGHTDRFKAAASQRSISNWTSKFCTTDIGYYFVDDQIGKTPWQDYNKLWDSSPLKYADKVKTPTLFIHSDEDYRCYIAEGIQMFTALKYHGVESRLCMFRGENHELSRSGKPRHRVRRLKEITEWFNKHLKTTC
jgi:dipeptidyl aminopeptidase/acylaminoacyl peptidase